MNKFRKGEVVAARCSAYHHRTSSLTSGPSVPNCLECSYFEDDKCKQGVYDTIYKNFVDSL